MIYGFSISQLSYLSDYLTVYVTTLTINNNSNEKMLFMDAMSKNLLKIKILLNTVVT